MKYVRPLYFIVFTLVGFFVFQACSSKGDMFDDSRKCTLNSEDVKDVFGNVVQKGEGGEDCPSVPFDPCNAQFKNQENLGEMSDSSDGSILSCPEVKENPILPSDYTEDDRGAIDLSDAKANEDTPTIVKKELMEKSNPESESAPMAEPTKELRPVLGDKVEKVAPQEEEVENSPSNEENSFEQTNSAPLKKEVKKTVTKKNKLSKKKNKVTKARKSSNKKSNTPVSKEANKKLVYKMSLGPFYKGKSYVPYQVKVSFENHLSKARKKYKSKKGAQWTYMIIAYTPSPGNSSQRENALARAKELAEYAVWKGKIPENCFKVKIKVAPRPSLSEYVEILVYVKE